MADNRGAIYIEDDKTVIRASQLGQCINQLLYHYNGFDSVPFPDGIMRVMNEGTLWEDNIVRFLRRPEIQGDPLTFWSIYAQQKEYNLEYLPGYVIRVHIDAIGKKFSSTPIPVIQTDRPYVHEYKTFGPDLLHEFNVNEFKNLPHYAYQLSIEMLATNLPGIFFVLDKEHSTPDNQVFSWRVYETPPIPKFQIIKRLILLDRYIRDGTFPPCEEHEGFCPYYKFHSGITTNESASKVRPTGTLNSQESDIVRRHRLLGNDIKTLRDEQDAIREILVKVCNEDTDYLVDDRTFGFYSSNRDEYDLDSLLADARSKGVDVEKYYSQKKVVSIRNGRIPKGSQNVDTLSSERS